MTRVQAGRPSKAAVVSVAARGRQQKLAADSPSLAQSRRAHSLTCRAATMDAPSPEPSDPWASEVRPAEETKAERDDLKHRLLGETYCMMSDAARSAASALDHLA